MNRLHKYILDNGVVIGAGCDRIAYLINNKIFKLECYKNSQNKTELEFLDEARKIFGSLDIFINIEYITDRVSKAEFVKEIAENSEGFKSFCRKHCILTNIHSYAQYCKAQYSDFKHEHVFDEIKILRHYGLSDFYSNVGNFGYSNGYVKIIDYGTGIS